MDYAVEYLPIALRDIAEIARYIAHDLQNPAAAQSVVDEIVAAAESLASFPYRNPHYSPQRALEHEFRRFTCGNYVGFYWVDEDAQAVTVACVLYARRDYDTLLRKV